MFPVLDKLDPNGFIMYRLVRDGKSLKYVSTMQRHTSSNSISNLPSNSCGRVTSMLWSIHVTTLAYNLMLVAATHFVDGHHVKSLDRLNRDLSKVIVIDWNENSTKFHPENTFNIPRWDGNDDDLTLFNLTAFLKSKFRRSLKCRYLLILFYF